MFVRELRAGASIATYLAGPIGPMYRRDDVGGAVKWYCYDALGSVLAEVDNTGTTTASRAFDVYGSVRNSTGTSTSKHKFVGQLGHTSDDETGLIYMRARYMDPATGTFVSEDPGRQGGNWYGYCGGNPVGFIDRTGRSWYFALEIIGILLIALGAVLLILDAGCLALTLPMVGLVVLGGHEIGGALMAIGLMLWWLGAQLSKNEGAAAADGLHGRINDQQIETGTPITSRQLDSIVATIDDIKERAGASDLGTLLGVDQVEQLLWLDATDV